jgi:hypothetical protein
LVGFEDNDNNYVYCIVSKTDVDRILKLEKRVVTQQANGITISGNLPEDNNDPDFVVVGSNALGGDGGGDGSKIKIMVLPQSSNGVQSEVSKDELKLARTLLKS